MAENISIIKAEIGAHDNWRIIENNIENKLVSKINIKFITFCEMYFYKGGGELTMNWIGIVHDPDDTYLYYNNKNLLENTNFIKSLHYCKGLFCMSNKLKDWIIYNIQPNFFVEVLYHPISNKNLKEFDMQQYIKNKNIIQIGNWLRKTYSIFKIKTNVRKELLPFNQRTQNELEYFLKKDKLTLTDEEISSVIKTPHISNEEYNKIFSNKIVFLDLYSSTANNVIIECIKANNPIIVNRLESIETYLGKDYPLFYNNLFEASLFLENDDLIFEAHIYLKNMNKNIFLIDNMVKTINYNLNMIDQAN